MYYRRKSKRIQNYITAIILAVISECIGTISFQVGWGKVFVSHVVCLNHSGLLGQISSVTLN